MTNFTMPTGIGALFALVVLVMAIVLFLIGKLDALPAIMFGLLALARFS